MEIKSHLTLDMLCGWARWSKDTGTYLGYPSKSLFAVSRPHDDWGVTEDEALTVDSIVSELKTRQGNPYCPGRVFIFRL